MPALNCFRATEPVKDIISSRMAIGTIVKPPKYQAIQKAHPNSGHANSSMRPFNREMLFELANNFAE